MALDNNTRLAIKAKLKLGSTPKEVAEEFDVGYQTVSMIARQLKEEADNDNVNDLMSIPSEVVAHIVKEAKSVVLPTPSGQAPMVEAFDKVVDGLDGLKKLDKAFHTTMTNILGRFDEMLVDKEMALKDIIQIANTTASAYEKVFSSGTNIHIGDNNSHSTQKLSVFKMKQGV